MKRLLHKEVSAGDALPTLEMEVTSTQVIAGALASRDHSPLHHDYKYATEQAGHKDIFINTFHQASLFERVMVASPLHGGSRGCLRYLRARHSVPCRRCRSYHPR